MYLVIDFRASPQKDLNTMFRDRKRLQPQTHFKLHALCSDRRCDAHVYMCCMHCWLKHDRRHVLEIHLFAIPGVPLCGLTLPRALAMVSNSSSSKSTGKRPSTIDENFDVGKRRAIVSDLAALNGVSKVGLARTLKALNDRGC